MSKEDDKGKFVPIWDELPTYTDYEEVDAYVQELEEKLEKVTKIADVVCAFYGAMYNDDPDDYYNNEFALQKQKELKEILKQQKAG